MNGHTISFFEASVRYLMGEPLPPLPELPGRVHRAPPPEGRDDGHPRDASFDRALQFAAAVADRKHWRHRP